MTDREKMKTIIKIVANAKEDDLENLWQTVHDVIAIVKPSRLMFCCCGKCESARAAKKMVR